jgi:hypothetical protein
MPCAARDRCAFPLSHALHSRKNFSCRTSNNFPLSLNGLIVASPAMKKVRRKSFLDRMFQGNLYSWIQVARRNLLC